MPTPQARFQSLMPNPDSIPAAFDRHEQEPNITVDQHIRRLMIDLGASISGRTKIYLDIRYWIYLRNAAMGRARHPMHDALLQELRRAVADGIAICPISDTAFVELLKQQDAESRFATASVMDELSGGVTLCTEDLRVGNEFAHFLFETGAQINVHPLQHLAWTRPCFVFGVSYPSETPFDAKTERVMQKAFVDYLWSMPFAAIVDRFRGDTLVAPTDFESLAASLNQSNRAHVSELPHNFSQAVLNEQRGVLDLYDVRLAEIMNNIRERKGVPPAPSDDLARRIGTDTRTMIFNAFLHRPEFVVKRLPTLYAHATCHAAVRWNRGKNLTGNDLMDFHHAAAALGYCDAFFTDNPLQVLLTQRHVALSERLDCVVTADDSVALEFVRRLG